MASELTGRELDLAVGFEVMGLTVKSSKTWPSGKPLPKGQTAYKLLWRDGRKGVVDFGGVFGWGCHPNKQMALGDCPAFTLSRDFAYMVESEIERRRLSDLYIHYLMPQVGVDGHKPGYDEADLWKIHRATPEQICRAALNAVRSAKVERLPAPEPTVTAQEGLR